MFGHPGVLDLLRPPATEVVLANSKGLPSFIQKAPTPPRARFPKRFAVTARFPHELEASKSFVKESVVSVAGNVESAFEMPFVVGDEHDGQLVNE
jgi:hypothetical protein